MAKLMILAAALIALLALTETAASAYRTTITVEEEDPQKCREEIQKQQQELHYCRTYLTQGGAYELPLRMRVNQQQQLLNQCCQQLENVEEECRCEAIREMVRQQQQQEGGSMPGQEMQEMVQRAQDLPRKCDLEPKRCQIRAVWF